MLVGKVVLFFFSFFFFIFLSRIKKSIFSVRFCGFWGEDVCVCVWGGIIYHIMIRGGRKGVA